MTTNIKISPIPKNLTQEQIGQQLGGQNASQIIVSGDAAYVTLTDSSVLERLAGKYGDLLRIQNWNATIEPLEESFNISTVVPSQSGSVTYSKVGEVLGQTLKKSQNLIGGVVSGVKDLIGSGISQSVGPTVDFKEYNSKMSKVINIIVAIWLICFLN